METIVVSEQQLADLCKLRDDLFQHRTNHDSPRPAPRPGGDRVTLPTSSSGREDATFRAAKTGEIPGTIDFTMSRPDLERITRGVRNAASYSDFTIATIHAYQPRCGSLGADRARLLPPRGSAGLHSHGS